MKHKILLVLLMIALMAGCSPSQTSPVQQTPRPETTGGRTATPTIDQVEAAIATLRVKTTDSTHEDKTAESAQASGATMTPTMNLLDIAIATLAAKATEPAEKAREVDIPDDPLRLLSPDGANEVLFWVTETDGRPYYSISHDGTVVIGPSRMGFTFKEAPALHSNLAITGWAETTFDEVWTQPWGEVKQIRDHHNELRVQLTEVGDTPRELVVVLRAFDDGVGLRYEFPQQPHLGDFQIMDELTQFAMNGDHQSWWIRAYQPDRYEYLYNHTTLSRISALARHGAHTPLTMQTAEGLYLSIHEAALTDYAAMALVADRNQVLETDLFPWSDGTKVKGRTPLVTPWRTIQIAENAGDLITSTLILNLNEPNALGDVSWVQPGKYIGIWWGMHINKWTWGRGPRHGATTANARAYIDFAAENGFSGVLVEGWNFGWDGDWTQHGDQFNFTTPYPDFDLAYLADYAAGRGVGIIGHHETGAAVANYEAQLEDAFAYYRSLGIKAVKTGYVGWGQGIKRYDDNGDLAGMEWHHGQYMVEHYRKVVETAARYGIMVNVHEPIKDTGIRRTYPNMLSREGARGQEYNAWDDNPPDHVVILPFTRLLAGPMDYTPGILDLDFAEYRSNRVDHTLAKELALYVVIYSPLQMAADLIENYVDQPAFQFIRDVAVDWQDTRVLHAQIGDFVTIVRQERDSAEWFLGSITDENPRVLDTKLDFLVEGVTYVAEIYADGEGAHYLENSYALEIRRLLVDSETRLVLDLAPGGGQAIRFYPASAEELETLPRYEP